MYHHHSQQQGPPQPRYYSSSQPQRPQSGHSAMGHQAWVQGLVCGPASPQTRGSMGDQACVQGPVCGPASPQTRGSLGDQACVQGLVCGPASPQTRGSMVDQAWVQGLVCGPASPQTRGSMVDQAWVQGLVCGPASPQTRGSMGGSMADQAWVQRPVCGPASPQTRGSLGDQAWVQRSASPQTRGSLGDQAWVQRSASPQTRGSMGDQAWVCGPASPQTRGSHGCGDRGADDKQGLYTPESAERILAGVGLSNEDLHFLSQFPEDRLNAESLPFIIRLLQANKSNKVRNGVASSSSYSQSASSSSGAVHDIPSSPGRSLPSTGRSRTPEVPAGFHGFPQTAGKCIDYGHASRTTDEPAAKCIDYGHASRSTNEPAAKCIDYGHASRATDKYGDRESMSERRHARLQPFGLNEHTAEEPDRCRSGFEVHESSHSAREPPPRIYGSRHPGRELGGDGPEPSPSSGTWGDSSSSTRRRRPVLESRGTAERSPCAPSTACDPSAQDWIEHHEPISEHHGQSVRYTDSWHDPRNNSTPPGGGHSRRETSPVQDCGQKNARYAQEHPVSTPPSPPPGKRSLSPATPSPPPGKRRKAVAFSSPSDGHPERSRERSPVRRRHTAKKKERSYWRSRSYHHQAAGSSSHDGSKRRRDDSAGRDECARRRPPPPATSPVRTDLRPAGTRRTSSDADETTPEADHSTTTVSNGNGTSSLTQEAAATVLISGLPQCGCTESDVIKLFGAPPTDVILARKLGKALVVMPDVEMAMKISRSGVKTKINDSEVKIRVIEKAVSLNTPVALYRLLNENQAHWTRLLVVHNVPDTPTAASDVRQLVRRFGKVLDTLVLNHNTIICETAIRLEHQFCSFRCVLQGNPLHFTSNEDPALKSQVYGPLWPAVSRDTFKKEESPGDNATDGEGAPLTARQVDIILGKSVYLEALRELREGKVFGFHCKLCDIPIAQRGGKGNEATNKHLKSREHVAALLLENQSVAVSKAVSNGVVSQQEEDSKYVEEVNKGRGVNERRYYCHLCECYMNGPNTRDQHLKGKTHAAKLRWGYDRGGIWVGHGIVKERPHIHSSSTAYPESSRGGNGSSRDIEVGEGKGKDRRDVRVGHRIVKERPPIHPSSTAYPESVRVGNGSSRDGEVTERKGKDWYDVRVGEDLSKAAPTRVCDPEAVAKAGAVKASLSKRRQESGDSDKIKAAVQRWKKMQGSLNVDSFSR